ncbi:hypothetical protein SRABI106_04403 [Rahnella aquatilis]|nr:hypothetical protein SRABI106_04403 [Rahnella aquatilis]
MDCIAFFKQKLSQIRPVLPGDIGNKSDLRHSKPLDYNLKNASGQMHDYNCKVMLSKMNRRINSQRQKKEQY